MANDYERMMEAALKLHGLKSPADVARLIGQYDQIMTNWKSRGIPAKELLDIAKIIGCDPFWLRDGEGEMVPITEEDRIAINIGRTLKTNQRQAWYHVGSTLAKPDEGTNGKK